MPQLSFIESVEQRIYLLRGQRVLRSPDLAELYKVLPGTLMQAVKRNIDRFPEDFMFQLSLEELEMIWRSRSQIVILKRGSNIKYLPYAFTENGVAMLSSVLRNKRAIQVNIEIMRTFTRLREMLSANKDLALKLEALEQRYDSQFKIVFDAIRQLMEPSKVQQQKIGFNR
jgi:hypothetical protein